MNPLRYVALTLLVATAMLVTPACSDGKLGVEDFCEAYSECVEQQGQAPEGFYDQCVEAFDQQTQAVEGTPCEDPYEDMIDCMAENMTCEDLGMQACEDELEDFSACQGPTFDQPSDGGLR